MPPCEITMSKQHSSSTTTLCICGVLAAIVAALFLIQGVEASRSTSAPLNAETLASLQPSSTDQETIHLSIDARVDVHARKLDETLRDIERTHRQISEAKVKLAKAQLDERTLPEQIKRLSAAIVRLDAELPAAANLIQTAKQESAKFRATIPARLDRTHHHAEATRDTQHATAVDQIALERQKRNELRARIGAQREDQEEVYHTLRERRKAKQAADVTYLATIEREQSKIAAEAEAFASQVANAEATHQRYSAAHSDSSQKLADAEKALTDAIVTTASTPSLLASVEADLSRLSQLKISREAALQIARREQQRRNEETALAKARKAESRQLASVPVNFAREHSSDHATWASASPSFSASGNSGSGLPFNFSESPYYDPGYRPSVGRHYVNSYIRSNGTYVHGHYKTNSDDSFWNNWSSAGNTNPYTGHKGTKLPKIGLKRW